MARNRHSPRLPGWDYRKASAYFVTICTFERECILANDAISAILLDGWRALGKYLSGASGDAFVVMPNHIHGIIWLPGVRAPTAVGVRHVEISRDMSSSDHRDGLNQTSVSLRASPLPFANGTRSAYRPAGSLGAVVGAFKSAATKRINRLRDTPQRPVWQRGYHDRIIRDERHLERAREYIRDNPAKWAQDPNNPSFRPPP